MSTPIWDILHQLYSMVDCNLEGSITILGDFLLSNSSELGLKLCPKEHYKVIIYYANSLYTTQNIRRAIHYFELGLKKLKQTNLSKTLEEDVSEASVRWRIYKCHMELKELDEALTVLVEIPQDQRDAKIWIAMAKLFHQVKNDVHSAAACYKQSLRKCPFAMEAIFGLVSLGYALPDVLTPLPNSSRSRTSQDSACEEAWSSLSKCQLLYDWLRAESMILQRNYAGAVTIFDVLTHKGMKMSADGNCQLAFCMEKLGKKESAKELFEIASCQDVHVVSNMDMYARLLATENTSNTTQQQEKLDKLCSQLLDASRMHSEPWVAQAWLTLISKDWMSNVCFVHRYIKKATAIRSSAEAAYVEGYVYSKIDDQTNAACKFSEALKLDNTFYEVYRDLIQCYLKTRPKRVAMNMVEMASKFLPPARHLYLEGTVWAHYMVTDKAARVLRKAIVQDHKFEEAAMLLANMYCKMGQVKMAAKVLSEQLSGSSSASLHAQLARSLMTLGQHQEAMDHFLRALSLDPELKEAIEGKEKLINSLSPTGIIEEGSASNNEQEGILTPFHSHVCEFIFSLLETNE